MPTIITDGAASAQGYGFAARTAAANFIEDVFSTYLYTGNGSTQTITNGIDLSGNGGLVWMKGRSGATAHALYDTARGATFDIASNLFTAQTTQATGLTSFNSSGFSIGALAKINYTSAAYTSWTFRKQSKFFDIVTYTGTGANRTIAHSLGSVPGCIVVKRLNGAGSWAVYHRSLANTQYMILQDTAAAATGATYWNSTTPTSSDFSLGTSTDVNASGGTYVAYLFAHDAGGFGASGSDNVISCGSFTSTGSALPVTLGYEPQWLLFKPSSNAGSWELVDNMRGFQVDRSAATVGLEPNLSNAEAALGLVGPTSTGFTFDNGGSGVTYIYIAIRRGPMKTPTSGTSVFSPIASSAATGTALTTGFPVDAQIFSGRSTSATKQVFDRLRGVSSTTTESGIRLITSSTAAETAVSNTRLWDNTGFQMPSFFGGISMVFWNFGRAPGFFDVVCYTGTGANTTVSHNLGVAPELMIVKRRSATGDWFVYNQTIGNTKYLQIQAIDAAATDATNWNNTSPTSSVFSLGSGLTNASSSTYVAYLFATVAGVSKVGSYTGTGATQQINCGFTGGARFVLIKRTDNTGGWYVWDSARGIVAGNDPYLLLNDSAAEVTGTDYVDTYAAGFEISSTAPAAINANGGSFIFLAIA